MILIYADGRRTEATLLARSENQLRLAVPGCDDAVELTGVHGTWVSEDCEPVRVEFAWQGNTRQESFTEAAFLCSHELAARLIHLLWNGIEDAEPEADAAVTGGGAWGMRADDDGGANPPATGPAYPA
jgi:hypothetical protein